MKEQGRGQELNREVEGLGMRRGELVRELPRYRLGDGPRRDEMEEDIPNILRSFTSSVLEGVTDPEQARRLGSMPGVNPSSWRETSRLPWALESGELAD